MIVMDIPMPANCESCPCSYYVQTGEYAGAMICNAREFKRKHDGFLDDLSEYFVVMDNHRPENCPMLLEVVK